LGIQQNININQHSIQHPTYIFSFIVHKLQMGKVAESVVAVTL